MNTNTKFVVIKSLIRAFMMGGNNSVDNSRNLYINKEYIY